MPSGPKSNKFMNRHAAEARERDQERQANVKAAREQAREDAKWVENDPKELKRQARQREVEEKARRQDEVRAERKEQLEQEEQELSEKVPQKVTRRQIQKDLSKLLKDYDKGKENERQQQSGALVNNVDAALPESNPNRAAKNEVRNSSSDIKASGGVTEVLSALQSGMRSGAVPLQEDRHIGKRARVLYRQFCEEHIPTLREEKPRLRRTQYDELLWEMWQKSPMNPFVQRSEQRSKERLEQERRWMEADDDDESEDDDEGKRD
ncbi:hypothetical protein TraAM80_03160 [Trypanosoma rangeli]|uniref:Coiled-coil domain-containing protein n=1 Tax=Trypanosoma rangeli TaxID=5698 RepID=A0A3R7NKC3_TRYRA|nr:uncharacterized protein TraAM80_03160 [Trypanosoma rangeli]RNF07786.1 hypothetical protein TraAM80_03160 [Trypanosoma rangeli]|eukprot:RNF07786.1 hypothetical protein TraAM80_03160 [Trypanosoma rangeli]